jgi:exopolysaccharide production protein ExoQ
MHDVQGTVSVKVPAEGAASFFAGLGFLLLLLLLFVTLSPFDPPDPTALNTPSVEGNALRQVIFVTAFAIIMLAALAAQGLNIIRAVPLTLGLLIVWCISSALWAASPDVVFRRATLATIVTLSTLVSARNLGPERAFRYLRIVLVCVLVVSWISIPLISTAVHLANEPDAQLIGDWRGIYIHKNGAGAMCALTALIFLFSIGGRRHWTDVLVILASVGFLIGTRSKTSMVLLPVAIMAGGIYRWAWRRGLDRAIVACFLLALFLLIGATLLYQYDAIVRLLEDPTSFTGRTEIWKADLAYLRDHPLLGSGFGTEWGSTGKPSFLYNYTSSVWVRGAANSHNGYMSILVGLGTIGLLLSLIALIVAPLARFWPLETGEKSRAGLFAIFVFILFHNFTEADFFAPDSDTWLVFLLVIASLLPPRGAKMDSADSRAQSLLAH